MSPDSVHEYRRDDVTTYTASAPGKVILLGEHAVVYGYPAIAVPVTQLQAQATVTDRPPGSGCLLAALDLGRSTPLAQLPTDDALALVARLTLDMLGMGSDPDWRITLHSQIPMASGLGSGAAIATALVRALFAYAGRSVSAQIVADLVFESEKLLHGTPSGIDNTVIAYEQPVWFEKGRPMQIFAPLFPITLAVADTGLASPTRQTVGDVRQGWQTQPAKYESLFGQIGQIVAQARLAMEIGQPQNLGPLFDHNQELLVELGVSGAANDRLVAAARAAGAAGAKLSGGGRGGNIIALVDEASQQSVQAALRNAGARRVLVTTILGA